MQPYPARTSTSIARRLQGQHSSGPGEGIVPEIGSFIAFCLAPQANPSSSLIHRLVRAQFTQGEYIGVVTGATRHPRTKKMIYDVEYSDGDFAQYYRSELDNILISMRTVNLQDILGSLLFIGCVTQIQQLNDDNFQISVHLYGREDKTGQLVKQRWLRGWIRNGSRGRKVKSFGPNRPRVSHKRWIVEISTSQVLFKGISMHRGIIQNAEQIWTDIRECALRHRLLIPGEGRTGSEASVSDMDMVPGGTSATSS